MADLVPCQIKSGQYVEKCSQRGIQIIIRYFQPVFSPQLTVCARRSKFYRVFPKAVDEALEAVIKTSPPVFENKGLTVYPLVYNVVLGRLK